MSLLHEQIEGKYEILAKIKEGGMGAIYKVRHRLLDEIRVVKVVRAHLEPRGETGERFLREARVANRLRHPNIAALHDFAIDEGRAFIVMEFIDGLNLLEILEGYGPPPLSLTLEIARQSLRALGYLHRQKIVHRDVSPDNLMLTRDVDGHPQIKLIDLGIAKAFEGGAAGLTTTGIFLGKPRYASPEQFGSGGMDARSDLYSFGVVLYELLTGRCPISGQDPASFMAGHLLRPALPFEESDPGGTVPPELRSAVMRSLAKKPENRYETAEDFAWALTLLQDRFPLNGRELEEVVVASLPAQTRPIPLPAQGSTQDRLDREFLMPPSEPTARSEGAESAATILRREEKTTALPLDDRTVPALAPLPREPREPSLLDDATWAVRPMRRREDLSSFEPTGAVPGLAEGSRGRPLRAVWISAMAAVLLLAGALAWLRPWEGKGPAEFAMRAASQPAGVLPAAMPIAAPGPASTPVPVDPTPTATPVPSPAPEPARTIKRASGPAPAASATPLPPMQRGDLIRAGMPGIQAPELPEFPAFAYPEAAKGSGRKVRVEISLLVDEEGRVIESRIQDPDSSGLGFDQTALEAARKARFLPATRDGIPGKMWTELIFEFAE